MATAVVTVVVAAATVNILPAEATAVVLTAEAMARETAMAPTKASPDDD